MKIESFDENLVNLVLSVDEVTIISNCINEARSFVGNEFELRCGGTLDEAKYLNQMFFQVAEEMQSKWEEKKNN